MNPSPSFSRRPLLGWGVIVLGLSWLAAVGALWLAGTPLAAIHVRWVSGTTLAAQQQEATALGVECERQIDDLTWFCAVLDPSPQALERIVKHPSVEDTHYLNRSTFVLENAPRARARRWAGRSVPIVGSSAAMALAGLLIAIGVYLLVKTRPS